MEHMCREEPPEAKVLAEQRAKAIYGRFLQPRVNKVLGAMPTAMKKCHRPPREGLYGSSALLVLLSLSASLWESGSDSLSACDQSPHRQSRRRKGQVLCPSQQQARVPRPHSQQPLITAVHHHTHYLLPHTLFRQLPRCPLYLRRQSLLILTARH